MKPSHFILSMMLGGVVTALFLGAIGLAAILAVLMAFLLVVAALGHVFRSRRAERAQRGLCGECGYDLRGSAERCPECGTPIPAKP